MTSSGPIHTMGVDSFPPTQESHDIASGSNRANGLNPGSGGNPSCGSGQAATETIGIQLGRTPGQHTPGPAPPATSRAAIRECISKRASDWSSLREIVCARVDKMCVWVVGWWREENVRERVCE